MNGQQEKYVLIACISSVVVLASIYFLFRKRKNSQRYYKDENDELVEYADLNAQDCVASAVQSRVEIQVPSFIVGSIIGKNGINIRQLKSQFGVRFVINCHMYVDFVYVNIKSSLSSIPVLTTLEGS